MVQTHDNKPLNRNSRSKKFSFRLFNIRNSNKRTVNYWTQNKLQLLFWSLVGWAVIFWLVYWFIFGNRGYISHRNYLVQIEKTRSNLKRVIEDEQKLVDSVERLSPKKLDPDMLEERIKNNLGLVFPNERVVILQRNESRFPKEGIK